MKSKLLKKRLIFLAVFVFLFFVEVLIALYVHDDFIRPFVGDVLVTALLCAMGRIVFPKWNWLPFMVMMFSFKVEIVQMLELDQLLGIEGTVLGAIFGSTFDPNDLVCYSVGIAVFSLTEFIIKRKSKE